MSDDSPLFDRLIAAISADNPLQKNHITKYLAARDDVFFRRAEYFLDAYAGFLSSEDSIGEMAHAYLHLCRETLTEQNKFRATRTYAPKSEEETFAEVYGDSARMGRYMTALAVSQFLWPQHYSMLDFFIDVLTRTPFRRYLEIGPGHGLYLYHSASINPGAAFEIVDISEESLRISASLLRSRFTAIDLTAHHRKYDDFSGSSYDLVVMGEVLEHLAAPSAAMAKTRSILSPSGMAFITTCANCPAVDHIYQFTSGDHIRSFIFDNGFDIVEERVVEISKDLGGQIAYGALLKPRFG